MEQKLSTFVRCRVKVLKVNPSDREVVFQEIGTNEIINTKIFDTENNDFAIIECERFRKFDEIVNVVFVKLKDTYYLSKIIYEDE